MRVRARGDVVAGHLPSGVGAPGGGVCREVGPSVTGMNCSKVKGKVQTITEVNSDLVKCSIFSSSIIVEKLMFETYAIVGHSVR